MARNSRARKQNGANEQRGAWGEAVSSRLFLLAPVSLRYEHTISTDQKGTACSLLEQKGDGNDSMSSGEESENVRIKARGYSIREEEVA